MGEKATVPTSIEDDAAALDAVFLALEDWACEDLSVAEAYEAIIKAVARTSNQEEGGGS